MTKNELNYGIERSREYTKFMIQEAIESKNIKTVRSALEIVGLPTSNQTYTGDELIDSGFVQVRKLFDQGWTKKRIVEEYLGTQSAPGGSKTAKSEKNSDEIAVVESALEEGALDVGEVLAEAAADYLVERFPQLFLQKLGQLGHSGNIRAAFARARNETQARLLHGAAETNRQKEMLENFDFSSNHRKLKSAAPTEEDEQSDGYPDPWSEYKLDETEGKNFEDPLQSDTKQT